MEGVLDFITQDTYQYGSHFWQIPFWHEWNGKYYGVIYDSSYYVRVIEYDPTKQKYTVGDRLAYIGGNDRHYYPNMAIDDMGKAVIVYGGHNSAMYYIYSSDEIDLVFNDASMWSSPVQLISSATYRHIVYYSGKFYVVTRDDTVGYGSNGAVTMLYIDINNGTHGYIYPNGSSNPAILVHGSHSYVYPTDFRLKIINGVPHMYLAYVWNNGSVSSYLKQGVIYSDDLGNTWKSLEGDVISTPADDTVAPVIDDRSPAWYPFVDVDSEGNVYFVSIVYSGIGGNYNMDFYLYYFDNVNKQWHAPIHINDYTNETILNTGHGFVYQDRFIFHARTRYIGQVNRWKIVIFNKNQVSFSDTMLSYAPDDVLPADCYVPFLENSTTGSYNLPYLIFAVPATTAGWTEIRFSNLKYDKTGTKTWITNERQFINGVFINNADLGDDKSSVYLESGSEYYTDVYSYDNKKVNKIKVYFELFNNLDHIEVYYRVSDTQFDKQDTNIMWSHLGDYSTSGSAEVELPETGKYIQFRLRAV